MIRVRRLSVLSLLIAVAVASGLMAGCGLSSNPNDEAVVIITETPAEDGAAGEGEAETP
jgi:hypothetical protein